MPKKLVSTAAAALAAAMLAAHAQAATIENAAGQFDAAITAFQPLGQTFTAIDTALLSIGFAYSDINPSADNEPITLKLFEGEGMGGALLATRSFTLPAILPTTFDTPVFVDIDFSGVSLVLGGVYTAALSAGASYKVAAVYGSDHYAGGHAIGALTNCGASCDLNFRVVGDSPVSAAPEPAAWALLLAGFGLAGGALRRARRVTAA